MHEVAYVKEACKEAGQKIKEKAGMRKAEERLKERELEWQLRNTWITFACRESIKCA